jgi:hypothetical protein
MSTTIRNRLIVLRPIHKRMSTTIKETRVVNSLVLERRQTAAQGSNWCWTTTKCDHAQGNSLASLSGSFMWVLFTLNRLSHRYFLWHDNVFIKNREKKQVSSRWNSVDTITNLLWVIKLNVYKTIDWTFTLRICVSSKFHFILYDWP